MSHSALPPEIQPGALDDDTARKVEELIEQEEGAQNRLPGLLGHAAVAVALLLATGAGFGSRIVQGISWYF